MIINSENANIREVAKRICSGEVFVYPTDTVYGIGCNAMDKESIKRVFEIKRRAREKPLTVAFSDMAMVLDYALLEEGHAAKLYGKIPGPCTFMVKNKRLPEEVTGGKDTVGIRIPDHSFILELIRAAGIPIVAASANISGEGASNEFSRLSADILKEVDFSLDGGRCGSGEVSTVINAQNGKILH
jgi:L-threonylcarbamoyladenylate synthase